MAGNVKVFFAAVLFQAILFDVEGRDDIFNTRVQIVPSSAVRDQIVKFQCDFTLVDGRDLAILYWETRTGFRIFSYNNLRGEWTVFDDYGDKVISYQYYESLSGGGQWDRRHVLQMKVDNCDRETYNCRVINQEVYDFGSDQQTLEIEAYFPDPEMCLEIDGRCHSGTVFRENTTFVIVRCSVSQASAEPDLTVERNGVDTSIEHTYIIEHLEGCLHNAFAEIGEQIVDVDVETTFRCEVNYGGTRRSSYAGITFVRA